MTLLSPALPRLMGREFISKFRIYAAAALFFYALMAFGLLSMAVPLWVLAVQMLTMLGVVAEASGLARVQRSTRIQNWLISGVIALISLGVMSVGLVFGQLGGSWSLGLFLSSLLSNGAGLGMSAVARLVIIGTQSLGSRPQVVQAVSGRLSRFSGEALLTGLTLEVWFTVWNSLRGVALAQFILLALLMKNDGAAALVVGAAVGVVYLSSLCVEQFKR